MTQPSYTDLRERLYTQEVDGALRKREYLLKQAFNAYSSFKLSKRAEVSLRFMVREEKLLLYDAA